MGFMKKAARWVLPIARLEEMARANPMYLQEGSS